MSTEDQQCSIANQQDRIAAYASSHDFSIVRTYEDAGKSGVVIRRRRGLMQLLKDVISGDANYKAILVYDVSRWGRFQNPDEAAHYEFICENAGIHIHYCAEQFSNDGTMPNSIMKALKRTMAAEYSRELSVKVYDGQKRIAQMGYKIGGMAVYGLRRMAISSNGKRKYLLSLGDRKMISSDKIILVPGPKNEVKCVQYIFHAAAYEGKTTNQIAEELQQRKVKFVQGREWDGDAVWRVLKNPQYAGCSVWNRTTCKMHTKRRYNPSAMWILKEDAFQPLVAMSTYKRVQKILDARNKRNVKPDAEVIGRLKGLLAKKGKLSHKIIEKAKGVFDPHTYYLRYGSYLKVYEMAGYKPAPEVLKSHRRAMNARLVRNQLLQNLHQRFPEHVQIVQRRRNWRKVLRIDSDFFVSVLICREFTTPGGLRRWFIRVPKNERTLTSLVCRVDLDSLQKSAYYVAPAVKSRFRKQKQFGEDAQWLTQGKKLNSLSDFYDAVRIVDSARDSRSVHE